MPETDDDHPKTLDQLEKELSADELRPEITSVESETADETLAEEAPAASAPTDGPPHPRDPGDNPVLGVSDDDLQQASMAAEAEPEPILKDDEQLHVEDRQAPEVVPAPFYRRFKFWFTTICVLLIVLALAWFIRPSRLWLVNLIGLKTEVTVTTQVQAETDQTSAELGGVSVGLNGVSQQTDEHGLLAAKVAYGDLHIDAQKSGYEPASQDVMLDFDPFFYLLGGQQPDENARHVVLSLKAVGTAFSFKAIDWLSGLPLTTGQFKIGDMAVKPDASGKVSVRLPATDSKKVKIKASFGGSYLDKQFELPLGSLQTVSFVPSGRHYFIKEQDGDPAVLSSNLDGSDVKTVVEGDSSESAAMNFTPSPNGKFGILASSREGVRDVEDSLLQKLYIVDLTTKKLKSVDKGLWFNFVDWSGDTLIYTVGERLAAGAELTQRLVSIDTSGTTRKDLASAAYFGTVRAAVGSVVYVRGFKQGETGQGNGPELRVLPVKGGTEKTLAYKVQRLTQEATDKFDFQTADGDWHQFNANTGLQSNVSTPDSTAQAFLMTASADGQHRVGIDRSHSKARLVIVDVATGKLHDLAGTEGATGPVRWVGNNLVFRLVSSGQTTDYAVSLLGGEPREIVSPILPNSSFEPPASFITFF